MTIKSYNPVDIPAIVTVFTDTFTSAFGSEEGEVVGGLAENLLTSTATEDLFCYAGRDNSRIHSAVIFSRLTLRNGDEAFILSPLAVLPDRQKQGVGQALIQFGLDNLKKVGVKIVLTYGDPNYYKKTGFHPLSLNHIEPPYRLSQPEGWIGQGLGGYPIPENSGPCQCVPALRNPDFW